MGRKQDNGKGFPLVGRQAEVGDSDRDRRSDIAWNNSPRGIMGVLLYYLLWSQLKLDIIEETRVP
jgi:hypothetical protein